MTLALYIVGVIAFAAAVVTGFLSGSFWGFAIALASGISSAIVFFALANILDKQDSILYRLQELEEKGRKYKLSDKKACIKCGYEHDTDYSSCPHCGHRE